MFIVSECCRDIFERSCWKQRILIREPRCRYQKYITDVLVRADISWFSAESGEQLLTLARHGVKHNDRAGGP